MDDLVIMNKSQLADFARQVALAVVADLRDDLQATATREVMDKRQVAEYLGKSPATIERWMAEKGLPFKKADPNAQPMFRRSEIDAWLASRN